MLFRDRFGNIKEINKLEYLTDKEYISNLLYVFNYYLINEKNTNENSNIIQNLLKNNNIPNINNKNNNKNINNTR